MIPKTEAGHRYRCPATPVKNETFAGGTTKMAAMAIFKPAATVFYDDPIKPWGSIVWSADFHGEIELELKGGG